MLKFKWMDLHLECTMMIFVFPISNISIRNEIIAVNIGSSMPIHKSSLLQPNGNLATSNVYIVIKRGSDNWERSRLTLILGLKVEDAITGALTRQHDVTGYDVAGAVVFAYIHSPQLLFI